MAKIYTYLIIAGIGAAAVAAFFLYAVNLGKSKCESAHAASKHYAKCAKHTPRLHWHLLAAACANQKPVSVVANGAKINVLPETINYLAQNDSGALRDINTNNEIIK